MKNNYFFVLLLGCLGLGIPLAAQTVATGYGAPATPLNICGGNSTFLVRINGAGGACASATLTVTMPAGYNYVPGTATLNAGTGVVSETSVSASGGTLTVTGIPANPGFTEIAYQVYADCSRIGSVASALVNYSLAGCTGTATATSNPFNAQYADLNIPTVTNSGFTGTVGNTYTRVITVQNGGFGSLTGFTVEDKSGNGFAIVSAVASSGVLALTKSLSGTDTVYSYAIAGATPDGIFSNGESITITETVRIAGCTNLTSNIEAFYGCNASKCTASTVNGTFTAGATINSALQPNLIWLHTQNMATCRGTAYTNTMRIINNGTALMVAPHVDLYAGNGENAFDATYPSISSYQSAFNTATITYKIGNAGTPVSISPDSTRNYITPASCLGGFAGQISLTFPNLAVGDTIYLNYEQKECCPANCILSTESEMIWRGVRGNWQYRNGCGTLTKSSTVQTFKNYQSTGILAIGDLPSDMAQGLPYTFRYDITGLSLSSMMYPIGSTVTFRLQLPAQTTWTGNTSDIQYLYRNSTTSLNFTSINYNAGTNVLTMSYTNTTTFGLDSLRNSFLFINNITLDCSKPAGSNVANLDITATQPGCGCVVTFNCLSSTVVPHCPASCTDGILPLNVYAQRVNFGAPDNDNNRQPDASGSLDMSKVRTNWVMHGDTLRFRYQGRVVNSTPSLVFTNGYVSFTNQVATYNSHMTGAGAAVRIYNSAGTQIGTASSIPYYYNVGTGRGEFDYSISALHSFGFPTSYTKFNDGDSIVIDLNLRMNGLLNGQYITPIPATTEFYVSPVANPTAPNQYKCDVFSAAYKVVGTYQASNGAKIVAVSGCDEVVVVNDYFVSVGTCCDYSAQNAFTNEFRPVNNFDSLIVTIPTGYTLSNATLEFVIGSGHGANTFTPAVSLTPVNPGGSPLIYKLGNQYIANGGTVPQPDEANFIYTKFYLRPTCTAPASASMPMRFTQTGAPGYADTVFAFNLNMTNTLNATMPTATLTALNPNITVTNSSAVWEIQVSNSTALTAPATWLAKDATVSGVTITSLQQITAPGGSVVTTIAPTGSVYQLGSLSGLTSKYYRVTASYLNCVKDSVDIAFGYQCSGYPTSVATAVCKQTAKLTVVPQPAALQLTILNQPAGTQDLCALLPYEMEVLNTSLAEATSLSIQAQLPASGGVVYEPGSYQISAPAGSPYVTLSDANVTIAGGAYTFSVPVTTLAELGSSEKYQIKFNMRSQACAFKSGGRLNFTPMGINPCSQTIIGSVQNSQPIRLAGVPVSINGFSISSTLGDTLYACSSAPANTLPYRFKMINNGPSATSNVDGFTIEVPAGFTFSATPTVSYAPVGLTLNATSANTAGGSVLYTFRTTAGSIAVGDSVIMTGTLVASNLTTISCGAKNAIKEEAIVSFTTTCVQDASTCTSDETVAEHSSSTFYVKRPIYSITSFSAEEAHAGVIAMTGTVVVENTNGYAMAEPMTIHLVRDVNLNGIIDFPADTDFGTASFTTNAGGTTSYTYTIPQTRTAQACPIIAEVSGTCGGGTNDCGYAQTYYNCSFSLPIQLTRFEGTVDDCIGKLSWTTAKETNIDHFSIEYSGDGKSFEEVGRTPSKNRNDGAVYEFSTGRIFGNSLYRLKAVEVNGAWTYSNTISLNGGNCMNDVVLFPNPAKDVIQVSLSGEHVSYELTDAMGRRIKSGTVVGHKIDLSSVPAGMYHVRIVMNESVLTRSISIVK